MQQLAVVPCAAAQGDKRRQGEQAERPAQHTALQRSAFALRQEGQDKIRQPGAVRGDVVVRTPACDMVQGCVTGQKLLPEGPFTRCFQAPGLVIQHHRRRNGGHIRVIAGQYRQDLFADETGMGAEQDLRAQTGRGGVLQEPDSGALRSLAVLPDLNGLTRQRRLPHRCGHRPSGKGAGQQQRHLTPGITPYPRQLPAQFVQPGSE